MSFSLGQELFFQVIANLFFSLQYIAGLAVEVERFASFVRLPWATISKTLQVEECFQRECQGEPLSGNETKEVFIFLTESIRSL